MGEGAVLFPSIYCLPSEGNKRDQIFKIWADLKKMKFRYLFGNTFEKLLPTAPPSLILEHSKTLLQ